MPIVPMNIADSPRDHVKQIVFPSQYYDEKHSRISSHNETEKQNTDSSQYGFEEHKKDPSQICGEKH